MAISLDKIPFVDQDNILPLTAFLVCGSAVGVILAALAFEHIGGYTPCPLCHRQRYVYYFAIPVAGLALLWALYEKRDPAVLALTLCAAGFAVNSALGVHHAGVEWGWWPGPSSCAAANLDAPIGNILEGLNTAEEVSCENPSWRFLGLSFAGYNAVISAGLALIAFAGSWLGWRREA